MTEEQFVNHIRKLAKHNADLRVEVRNLRMEVTNLKDEQSHYQREFARQNAKLLELTIRMSPK